jgi:hypothetical protein
MVSESCTKGGSRERGFPFRDMKNVTEVERNGECWKNRLVTDPGSDLFSDQLAVDRLDHTCRIS